MPEPRRTFGPVLVLGLASGTLAAVAGTKPWVVGADGSAPDPLGLVADAGEMPLGLALALVLLACWGVLLVSRGAVRRLVAGLGLLAALGLAATVGVAFFMLPDQVSAAQRAALPTEDVFGSTISGWYVVAAVSAVISVVTTALAVWWAPAWPEMGRRYDAPGSTRGSEPTAEEPSSLDLWKSIDEGRDPTVGSG